MAKRKKKPKRVPRKVASPDLLSKALARLKKAELVDVIMELASADRSLRRRLELRFDVNPPPEDLLSATRQAIVDATDFDERDMNYNFDYDYEAYRTIQRNFGRLIEQGHPRAVMQLALELMRKGSYQVEMSDEGMMSEDIEECLQVVIKALRKCDLPAADVIAWCETMLAADRIGCHCDTELKKLCEQFGE
jgi:hypothetical protein